MPTAYGVEISTPVEYTYPAGTGANVTVENGEVLLIIENTELEGEKIVMRSGSRWAGDGLRKVRMEPALPSVVTYSIGPLAGDASFITGIGATSLLVAYSDVEEVGPTIIPATNRRYFTLVVESFTPETPHTWDKFSIFINPGNHLLAVVGGQLVSEHPDNPKFELTGTFVPANPLTIVPFAVSANSAYWGQAQLVVGQ